MRFRKIFNVSLHRGGRQSVHDLLVRSGLSSIHWPGIVKGVNYQELAASHEDDPDYVAAVLAPVIEMVTAVSDVPISALYPQLAAAYGGSAFILTFRNPFDCTRSVRAHIGERDLNIFEKVQYWRCLPGRPTSLRELDDSALYAGYLTHTLDVLRFFEGRRDGLFVDLHEAEAGERVCRFLALPPIPLRRVDFRRGDDMPPRYSPIDPRNQMLAIVYIH